MFLKINVLVLVAGGGVRAGGCGLGTARTGVPDWISFGIP